MRLGLGLGINRRGSGGAVADFIVPPVLSYNSGTAALTVTLDALSEVGDVIYYYWTVAAVWGNTPDDSYTLTADDIVAGFYTDTITITTPGTYNLAAIQYRSSTTAYSAPSNSVEIVIASLTYVGYKTASRDNAAAMTIALTALSGGIGGDVQNGDTLVLFYGVTGTADLALTVSNVSGVTWTRPNLDTGSNEIYSNSTHDTNFAMAHATVSGTPAASFTVSSTSMSTANSQAAILLVFRGANSAIEGTAQAASGTDSVANGAALTPAATGSIVISGGAAAIANGNAGDYATAGTPSGWGEYVTVKSADGTNRDIIMYAMQKAWTSGAIDPPAIDPTNGAAAHSWATVTTAVKPA